MKPLIRNNLCDEAYNSIIGYITSSGLVQGDKIPSESQLMEMLNVGRNTIRAALNRLTAIGLIESRQGEGYFLRDVNVSIFLNSLIPVLLFSSGDLIALTEFRIGVESQAAYLAATNADEEDLKDMKKYLQLAYENIDNETLFAKCDMDFHLAVAKASKNKILYQLFEIIRTLYTVWLVDFVANHGKERSDHFHNEVYQAIQEKDSEKASLYMKQHLYDVLDKVRIDAKNEVPIPVSIKK
jgi:GntR family transcriptional repressor for pyruvate dehydrogenase complex